MSDTKKRTRRRTQAQVDAPQLRAVMIQNQITELLLQFEDPADALACALRIAQSISQFIVLREKYSHNT